ncbi:rhodanese-like domain-containing protein [Sanguibacter sp. A247]|uniref:rhodanese-like domain-containing protein n=1 Tax=unclassified Sanguibacter TaxID=2645534 RepID=UPI003FD78EAC
MTPHDAWDQLTIDPHTVLVDVRTVEEWQEVGVPDSPKDDAPVRFIEWASHLGPNPHFVAELEAAGVPKDATVFFLCRSGGRSIAAAEAATAAGWASSYNVLQGFEGDFDALGGRSINGWLNAGLPTTTYTGNAR